MLIQLSGYQKLRMLILSELSGYQKLRLPDPNGYAFGDETPPR